MITIVLLISLSQERCIGVYFFGMNIQPYATYCCIVSWLISALINPLLNKAPALKFIE